jgi:hypothetical protein
MVLPAGEPMAPRSGSEAGWPVQAFGSGQRPQGHETVTLPQQNYNITPTTIGK